MMLFKINCTLGVGETPIEFLYSDEDKAFEHFGLLNRSPARNITMRTYQSENGRFVFQSYLQGDK
jgi:hypothetical protein